MCYSIFRFSFGGRVEMDRVNIRGMSMDDISMLLAFDNDVFPHYMLMSEEACEKLVTTENALLVEYYKDTLLVGTAYAVPAGPLEIYLQEVDTSFKAEPLELYSYSEGVLPAYQNQGIGTVMLQAMAKAAQERGYQRLSAHVRTQYKWADKRARTFPVVERRIVPGFWGDRVEPVEYQLIDLTKL